MVGSTEKAVKNSSNPKNIERLRRLTKEKSRCGTSVAPCLQFPRLLSILVDIAEAYLPNEIPVHGEPIICSHGPEY